MAKLPTKKQLEKIKASPRDLLLKRDKSAGEAPLFSEKTKVKKAKAI